MASQSPDQESAPPRPNLSVFILEAPPNSNSTNNDGGGDGVRSEQYDRIVFIDPITQSMIVLQGANLGSLFSSSPKEGHRPASKAAVAAMKGVEEGSGECAICLDEWEGKDTVVKEMPCKHRFHGECIEKWLRIHGNCPVCGYAMPVDEEEESGRMNGGEVVIRFLLVLGS